MSWTRTLGFVLGAGVGLAACGPGPDPVPPGPPKLATCRVPDAPERGDSDDEAAFDARRSALSIRWTRPTSAEAREELDRWCSGVGPPLLLQPPRRTGTDRPVTDLPIVVWNVHVGAGDVDGLVADLKAGRITGEPEAHFVLLFQEARRDGGRVPRQVPARTRGADRIHGASGGADMAGSIEGVAARHGLYAVYVPSMRNGQPDEVDDPGDRGNAILSTLPLTDPEAIELPLQTQRRVAVAATISGRSSTTGGRWALRLVNLHLDHRSPWKRIHESLGSARTAQVNRLIERLETEGAVAVGGDLNTWFGGTNEGAVQRMRASFPEPKEAPTQATLDTPLFPDRAVDHLFFRVPQQWEASYRVLGETYGSDHRPLIGRVEFSP